MFSVNTQSWFEKRVQADMASWRNPSWGKLFILWPWAIGMVCLIYVSIFRHQVAMRQKVAPGEIVASHQDHDRYAYTFVVEGKPYEGSSNSSNELTVGQEVTIYYDPKDPTTNSLEDFSELSMEFLGPITFLVVACGTGVLVIFLLRREDRKRASFS